MKKVFVPMACIAILGFSACKDNASETTTETSGSDTVSATTSGDMQNSGMESSMMDPDSTLSYMDLKSGKTMKLKRDASTKYMVNRETNDPVWYYINPATNDTFDRSGRMVSNAMMKGADGEWSVDESRLKVKTQMDGDVKMKDRDDNTKVKLEENGDGKIKTDTSKVKVKDGKVIEKKKN